MYSKHSDRPKGLMSFTSHLPGSGEKVTNWIYKAPTTGQTVEVATYYHSMDEVFLICSGYQTTKITARCVRSVFEDLVGKDRIISFYRKKGDLYSNGVKIKFGKLIKVWANQEVSHA